MSDDERFWSVVLFTIDKCEMDSSLSRCPMNAIGPFASYEEAVAVARAQGKGYATHVLPIYPKEMYEPSVP